MNKPDRFRVESLFDVEGQVEAFENSDLRSHGRNWIVIAVAVCAALLLILAVWSVVPPVTFNVTRLQVVGNRVGQLQPGGVVMLGGVEVGRVKTVGLEDSQPIASVQLDASVARKLPGDSKFILKALNNSMPGNVGIEIIAGQDRLASLPTRVKVADESSFVTELSDHLLRSLGDVSASQSLAVQPQFSATTASAVALAVAISIAIVLRTLRAALPAIVVCVLVVAIGVYLVQQKIVSIESASAWVSGSLHGLQPTPSE